MLKKSNKLQLNPKQNTKPYSTHANFYEQNDINKLFLPPYRQIFQLEYLYASPLCLTYPAFMEVVQIIQYFNAQTLEIQNKRKLPSLNGLKILCIRFIYREMLSIAVMNQHQIDNNDYANKLKNWYFALTDRHSFLQGVSFKKKTIQVQKIQELIRKSYVSNVFDQIDDYLRKKLNFQDESKSKQNELRKTFDEALPMIDIQLYKREEALMRNYRQKAIETKYFKDIQNNKAQMRQISLNHIQNKQLTNLFTFSDLTNSIKQSSSMHVTLDSLKNNKIGKSSKSLVVKQDNFQCNWKKKPFNMKNMMQLKRKQNKQTLLNINGINLIDFKAD